MVDFSRRTSGYSVDHATCIRLHTQLSNWMQYLAKFPCSLLKYHLNRPSEYRGKHAQAQDPVELEPNSDGDAIMASFRPGDGQYHKQLRHNGRHRGSIIGTLRKVYNGIEEVCLPRYPYLPSDLGIGQWALENNPISTGNIYNQIDLLFQLEGTSRARCCCWCI